MIRTLPSSVDYGEIRRNVQGTKKPNGRAKQGLEFFKALYEDKRLARSDPPEGETRIGYTYWLRQKDSIMDA
jgi:transposase